MNKLNKLLITTLLISTMLLVGCAQNITCAEPNKIINKECCLDEDGDDVCDYDQVEIDSKTQNSEPTIDRTYNQAETDYRATPTPEPEPTIDRSYTTKPVQYTGEPSQAIEEQEDYSPNYQEGISDIRLSEPKQWVQIHKLSSYRSSRDKGQMEWMYYTVRNLGTKPMKLGVDLMFQYGITPSGTQSPIGKEYTIEELEPGEKITINQSLGMYFEGVEETKTITLDVYNRFTYPKEDLQIIKKSFKPVDIMDTLEIMQYGRDD